MKRILTVTGVVLFGLVLAGCPEENAPKAKATQAQKAQQAADSISFTENAEIDNIKKRLQLTSQPGLLGYVGLVNRVGQVALYTPVKGKITSGGKRLTKPVQRHAIDRGQHNGSQLGPAPSDEGTWGSSNPYVYFWTPSDRYIQTSMEYVYSDQPFRLTEKPLMVIDDTAPAKDEARAKAPKVQ